MGFHLVNVREMELRDRPKGYVLAVEHQARLREERKDRRGGERGRKRDG